MKVSIKLGKSKWNKKMNMKQWNNNKDVRF